jgi:preprotein translocase subunit SecB
MEFKMEGKVGIEVQNVYLKGISFETNKNINVFFKEGEQENIDLERVIEVEHLEGNLPLMALFQLTLNMTVTIKQNDNTMVLVEVEQSGVFKVMNCTMEDASRLLYVDCAHILEPYAHQNINDMIIKSTYNPLILQPFDFNTSFLNQRLELE